MQALQIHSRPHFFSPQHTLKNSVAHTARIWCSVCHSVLQYVSQCVAACVCNDTFRCEQTAFLTVNSGLLGTTLTSDAVWRYFFKAVQRPSLLPKDSSEFLGWYDTLPQTQPKESEGYQAWKKACPQMQPKESEAYQGWQTATPQMQPKKSEAFRGWLQADRKSASKQSVDSHAWFKAKPPTADTDKEVRRLWYSQKPVTCKSLTGPDA